MTTPRLVAKASEVMRASRQRDAAVSFGDAPGCVLADLLVDGTGSACLEEIREKVDAGARITPQEGLWLLTQAPLAELGELANIWRYRHNPERRVTFVVDTNPNYTNFCDADCLFCAFYRKPGDAKEGYAQTIDDLMSTIGRSVELGATTVLLQGGLYDELPLSYYLDVTREFRKRFPEVHPHLFSAPEIGKMREVSELEYDDIFRALSEAGLTTMPGGGAELLSDRVRARISPKKQSSLEWLEVHRAAHRQGLRTTATMMYGHAEQPVDIIEHLECLRRVQDDAEGEGFTAFIPWSYKAVNTPMERQFPDSVGPSVYLRVLALARLYLDNVRHMQASWFSEGKKAGQVALQFGTDDFGGTLIEENVLHEAAHDVRTTTEETIELIRESGFRPARRQTPLYDVVETY
ncbi:MAG TPA: CofH family radical SAM protein [Acidobacteriota bacterium]|nr:CofH family radical SAM protein [Acidobacteriota bacterium]